MIAYARATAAIEALLGLSVTTLAVIVLALGVVVVLRRKGYGVRLGLTAVVLTAHPGSRRFPEGVNVRISTRIVPFLLGGGRGPWLDVCVDRFFMRLRPAAPKPTRTTPGGVTAATATAAGASGAAWTSGGAKEHVHLPPAWSAPWRWLKNVSAALSVEDGYWRVVVHNLVVHIIVILLRGIRLRAEHVHIWRQGAHWSMKAEQIVYVGAAEGIFGSRYDLSVNEISVLSEHAPIVRPRPTPSAKPMGMKSIDNPSSQEQPSSPLSPKNSSSQLPPPSHSFALPSPSLSPPLSSDGVPLSPLPSEPYVASAAAHPALLRVSLDLRKGIHFSAHLTPRALTIFRPRRMAIMDDIRLSADVRDLVVRAGTVASLLLEEAKLVLCPGYSRSLRAKLPPSAPSTRRPRKPGLLRYWECTGSVTRVYARLVPPPMGTSTLIAGLVGEAEVKTQRGLFARLQSAKFDACGMAADERQEAMSKATLEVQHIYAGSTAVEKTARAHCEALAHFTPPLSAQRRMKRQSVNPTGEPLSPADVGEFDFDDPMRQQSTMKEDDDDEANLFFSPRSMVTDADAIGDGGDRMNAENGESRGVFSSTALGNGHAGDCDDYYEHAPPLDPDAIAALESFVKDRPEAIIWIAHVSNDFDMNCAKRDAVRFNVRGDGAVVAIEPNGLLMIFRNAIAFSRTYSERQVTAFYNSLSTSSPSLSDIPDGEVLKRLRGVPDAVEAAGAVRLEPSNGANGILSTSNSFSPATETSQSLGTTPTAMKSEGNAGEYGDTGLRSRELSVDSNFKELDYSSQQEFCARTAIFLCCDLKRLHAVVLGDGPVGEGDTLALILGVEHVSVPRIVVGGRREDGVRLSAVARNLRVDHWTQWTRSANLVCDECSFNNTSNTIENHRQVCITGLIADWDMDLQSALEELPERFVRLAKVKTDSALSEFTRQLYAASSAEHCLSDIEALSDNSNHFMTQMNGSSAAFLHIRPANPGTSTSATILRKESVAGIGMAASHVILADEAALAEVERRERRERRRERFMETLRSWILSGKDITLAASFADGPRMVARSTDIPPFSLADEWYVCRHVTVTLCRTRIVYGAELRLENPIHTMSRTADRRRLHIDVHGFRAVLRHDYWFGQLLQDWILRLKAVLKVGREARYRRKGLPMQRFKKKPFPDVYLKISDVEFVLEDHPLGAFLTNTLPLMQDEALERQKRFKALNDRLDNIRRTSPVDEDTARQAQTSLQKMDAEIFIARMRQLKRCLTGHSIAPGYISPLEGHPMAKLTAATITLELVMDEATKKDGSAESIRKLKKYDSYLLGSKKFGKTRQYDVDAWNSIGFRHCNFEAVGVRLKFRDYPSVFVSIDRMYFESGAVVGQAIQGSVPPFIAHATVAVGRRRVVNITRGLGVSRTFFDCHLIVDHLQCEYNPAYLPAIADFARALGRFSSGSKNPSPRIPWFDTIRSGCHGQFRITARTLSGKLSSSDSPYTLTDHYVSIKADNVTMFVSRLAPTADDHYPISWEVHNWQILPRVFKEDAKSCLLLKYVKVSLNPVPATLSGDAQDHYFMPFPSKDEVIAGGPGIGRAKMELVHVDSPVDARMNDEGSFTKWTCPLLTADHDSFTEFKTRSMSLGIEIQVRQAPAVKRPIISSSSYLQNDGKVDRFWSPEGSSVLHSDGVTTLIKVVTKIIHRPVSNRAAPRWIDRARKPPCLDGLSVLLMSLDLDADVRDVNIMFYDNMRRGHGLFVSSRKVSGGMSKEWKYEERDDRGPIKQSSMNRRVAHVQDVYTALRSPKLELADDRTNCGFLFSLSSLRLLSIDKDACASDLADCEGGVYEPDEARLEKLNESDTELNSHCGATRRNFSGQNTLEPPFLSRKSAWFGEEMKGGSPFYTFSSNHPLQRSKKLDTVLYKEALIVDGIRILWTPMRRDSIIAWPEVFKEKIFAMRGIRPSGLRDHEDQASLIRTPRSGRTSGVKMPKEQTKSNCVATDSIELCNHGAPADSCNHGAITESCNCGALIGQKESTVKTASNPEGSGCKVSGSANMYESADSSSVLSAHLTQSRSDRTDDTTVTEQRDVLGSLLDLLGESKRVGEPNASSPSSSFASDAEPKTPIAEKGLSCVGMLPKKSDKLVTSIREVLDTNAKFQLKVSDSQVCFGSPETMGLVFFTSESACVGFVDKTVQQTHQCGGSSEKWIDTEYRVLLRRSRLYSQPNGSSAMFYEQWVPKEAAKISNSKDLAAIIAPMTRVTVEPISMHMMYIRSRSLTQGGGDEEDHTLRPALLFINVPLVRMDSTSSEFHSVTDVVRKVLMRRMPHSEIVKEELAALRYNLHLAGGPLSNDVLADYCRRLSNITKQLMYAGDTFQEHLVGPLLRKEAGDFQANLVRYAAKSKAVATYLRSEHRARGAAVLYPTMYISYSFDGCSWNLRDKSAERKAFVELRLEHLVCRHIFYIGKGSSAEFTFRDIAVVNHLADSGFKGVLYPSKGSSPSGSENQSKIKASDGTPVVFRWSATQMESVGGIPVYDVLTINLAPLNASVTSQLAEAVLEFAFGKKKLTDVARSRGTASSGNSSGGSQARAHTAAIVADNSQDESLSNPSAQTRSLSSVAVPIGSANVAGRRPPAASLHERSLSQDVEEMHQRGRATMLFRYVYIGEFELTASYRKNEYSDSRNRFLDIDHLTVNLPSYMYSSQVWTWADFASQIRRELLFTFAFRGVSNLAKIKLLPGYQRAHRGIKHGADMVKQGTKLVLKSSSAEERSVVDTRDEAADEIDHVHRMDSDEASDPSLSGDELQPHRTHDVSPDSPDLEEDNTKNSVNKQVLVLRKLYGSRLSRVNTVGRPPTGAAHLDNTASATRTSFDDLLPNRAGHSASAVSAVRETNADERVAKPPRLAYFRRRPKDAL